MATTIDLQPTEKIVIDIYEALAIRQMYYLSRDLFGRLVDQLPEDAKQLNEYDQLALHNMDILGDFITRNMDLIKVIEEVHFAYSE